MGKPGVDCRGGLGSSTWGASLLCSGKLDLLFGCFFLVKNWSCAKEFVYFSVNKGKAFKDLLITQVKKKGNLGSRMKLRI